MEVEEADIREVVVAEGDMVAEEVLEEEVVVVADIEAAAAAAAVEDFGEAAVEVEADAAGHPQAL